MSQLCAILGYMSVSGGTMAVLNASGPAALSSCCDGTHEKKGTRRKEDSFLCHCASSSKYSTRSSVAIKRHLFKYTHTLLQHLSRNSYLIENKRTSSPLPLKCSRILPQRMKGSRRREELSCPARSSMNEEHQPPQRSARQKAII